MPLHLNQKFWNDPKKRLARQETIIDQYRKRFHQTIPPNKQYWTMCGQCVDKDGRFQEGCELSQMLKDGFIQPAQFHGVEIDSNIAEANRRAFPEANWYTDDFYRAMQKAKIANMFSPAIVNADFINMPDRACGYLADIMGFLSSCVDEVMIVANFVLLHQRFTRHERDMEFVIEKLNKDGSFQLALKTGNWRFDQKYYRYAGTGRKSRTIMGTVVFYKEH